MEKRKIKRRFILCIVGALLLAALPFALRHAFRTESREVIILMYHHLAEEAVEDNAYIISREAFRAQMEALRDAGFETVNFDDLIAFVDDGAPLPERAVVITFDDGYRSNLEIAAPILEELGMQATINVIGVSRGRDAHWRTGDPIIPHFSFAEARPWVEAGVIQIQPHSHDMHQSSRFEPPETFRTGVLQREGESDADYRAAFIADFNTLRQAIEDALGTRVTTYAYPHGLYTTETEDMLRELGVRVTLSTHAGINTIRRGDADSLFLMYRINMKEDIAPEQVIEFLESFRYPSED